MIPMALTAWVLLMTSSMGNGLANQPVSELDLKRYAGTWHEIAHLPLYFQKKCVSDITAAYTVNDDNTVQVRNACQTRSGSLAVATGVARPSNAPGALKVSFAPRWLQWISLAWADYWVVDLDPHYQWAVVGSPSKKYLWVLSRSSTMSSSLFQQLKQRAALRGYPVNKLIVTARLR